MLGRGDERANRENARSGPDGPSTAAPDGISVLIVDDDPNFCVTAVRALERTPFRPATVATGADLLRFLARTAPFEDAPRPAFVVLDFNLPDDKAPTVLASLRTDPRWRALPVLVLSQIPGRADEEAALAAGAQSYRAKPSSAAAFRELVADFWRTHGDPRR